MSYETKKSFENFYYRKTTNHCRVDYKSEKKLKSERIFFHSKRSDAEAATELEPEEVDRGRKIATHFKGRNISTANTEDFYRNSGKELPPQIEMRCMTPLTNHWKAAKPTEDFDLAKMKEDMKAERIRRRPKL